MSKSGSKKRKPEADVDSERSLYTSFVTAANSVSQLYSAALAQSRESEQQGRRDALERVLTWVTLNYSHSPALPTGLLVELLQRELQSLQPGSYGALPSGPPASQAGCMSDGDGTCEAEEQATFKRSGSGMLSPARRNPGLAAMYLNYQQQQQQQQQFMQPGQGPPGQ